MSQAKLIGILVVVAAVILSFSVFTVDERERAILFQLGRVVKSDYTPGLHFKVPFIQDVKKFDRRIQTLDSEPELYLTSEKKNVKVDSYVKWQIVDVERFYTATGGTSVFGMELMLSVAITFCAFYILCAKLLDMDAMEVMVLFLLLIIGPFVAAVFLAAVLASLIA